MKTMISGKETDKIMKKKEETARQSKAYETLRDVRSYACKTLLDVCVKAIVLQQAGEKQEDHTGEQARLREQDRGRSSKEG